MSQISQDVEVHPAWGAGVSAAFWLTLLASALLFGVFVWAPHLVDQDRLLTLQAYQHERITVLQSDIRHWQMLKDTLEHDVEFARHLASSDLNQQVSGPAIPVDSGLQFDPHQSHPNQTKLPNREPLWCLSLLQELARPGQMRTNWLLVTAGLCLLAFTCLHEGVFHGPFGRTLQRVSHWLQERYQAQPPA